METEVPLLNGTHGRYVNLDNASSTPSFIIVQNTINNFLEFYSSVHRGSGFKSQLSTHAYNQAQKIVMVFLNASDETYVCIFVRNTTDAINVLDHRFPFDENRPIVVKSEMEHHSNDLPWRAVCQVVHVGLTLNGQLNLKEFNEIIDHYHERIGLIAISGGSNVTGCINPIHDLAKMAHSAGDQIAVDCAQLAAHREIDMPTKKSQAIRRLILAGDKTDMPGMVRASFELYKTKEYVNIFAEALQTIIKGNYQGN